MGTSVLYNGVTLHNVITREWNQEVKYDESNTDAMYHTFKMRFEGLLHAGSLSGSTTSVSVGGSGASNMPDQYDGVHRRILTPRQHLVVYASDFGDPSGEVLFQCDPAPGDLGRVASLRAKTNPNRDVDAGPKPKSFRVLQVIGAKCLRVAFEIECAKLVCPGGGAVPPYLSNRWAIQEAMDENQFITRTIDGTLRLSLAMASSVYQNSAEVDAINAKYLIVPMLEVGFRRVAFDFSTVKSGLECHYRITDRQVHTAAPWPATKMSARHTQSTNDGINMTSEVHVELEGPPHADKKHLIARAIQVIDAKLNFAAMLDKVTGFYSRFIPEHISVVDYIGDSNRVAATARFLETPTYEGGEPIKRMLGNLRASMGKPLQLADTNGQPWPYDPSISTTPFLHGSNPPEGKATVGTERRPAVLLMLQCYLQQPCVNNHALRKGTLPSPSPPPKDPSDDKPAKTPKGNEHPPGNLPGAPPEPKWSESAKTSVYTYSRMCSRYETNQLTVQLPIA